MKKSESYINRRKKLFRIIFIVPTILFLFLCNFPIFMSGFDFNELSYGLLIGEFSIICIWFTISFAICNIIASIFYKKDVSNEITDDIFDLKQNNNQSLAMNNDVDNLDNKVFTYNFKNVNIYKTLGEANYFAINKEKYLKDDRKKKIKNSFNQLIIVGIFTGICFGLFNIKYLLIFSILFVIVMFYKIKMICKKRIPRSNYYNKK